MALGKATKQALANDGLTYWDKVVHIWGGWGKIFKGRMNIPKQKQYMCQIRAS